MEFTTYLALGSISDMVQVDAPAGNVLVAIDFMGMEKNGMGSHLSHCTSYINYVNKIRNLFQISATLQVSCTALLVETKWQHTCIILGDWQGSNSESFATKQAETMCSHVSESHPIPVDMWGQKTGNASAPTLSLQCPLPNQVISAIKFTSYGTPDSSCESFSNGQCSSTNALSIVQKACVGSKYCSIAVSTNTFGDPCEKVTITKEFSWSSNLYMRRWCCNHPLHLGYK